MNAAALLQALRRFWWLVLSFALLGAIIAAIPEPERKAETSNTTYTAHFSILMSTDDVSGFISTPLVNQIQVFATRGEVPKRAALALGKGEGEGPILASQLQVVVDSAAASVDISTSQAKPEEAVGIVNAFGDELVKFMAEHQDDVRTARLDRLLRRQGELEAEIKDLQVQLGRNPDDALVAAKLDSATRQYSIISEQYDTVTADNATLTLTPLERGVAIEQTTTERGLAAPKSRTSRGILGFIIGLAAGLAVALVLVRIDRRIRSREQAEGIFGSTASVNIPLVAGSNTGLEVRPENHDLLSDSYRTLRSVVTFSQAGLPRPKDGRKARVTLIISAGPGDGKTSVTANLAAAAAESGKRVVAVNADFRRPTLMGRLAHPAAPPLPLTVDELIEAPLRQLLRRTPVPNLVVLDLSSIVASPGSLARTTAQLLPEVAAMCDTVEIDSSPIGLTAEVLDLLPLVDTIVMVIRLNHTMSDAAVHTLELVRSLTTAKVLLAIVGDNTEATTYESYTDKRRQTPADSREITRPIERPAGVLPPDDD
ncbi:MAG TPA: hypothetical protein PLV13_05165 [Ilumatobacteraceae bacterium]|nr:hypothetical protein [Ilumatobacteraceae bacterium]